MSAFTDYSSKVRAHDATHPDLALGADSVGWGIPMTFHPHEFGGATVIGAINRAHYLRVRGGCQPGTPITKLAINVGVQSGNISVAVLRGTAGRNPPTTRIATSGSVACPAAGYAEIALDVPVMVDGRTDWFALACDNNTATFGRVSAPGSSNNFGAGLAYLQDGLFPVPAAPTGLTASWRASFIIVGVP